MNNKKNNIILNFDIEEIANKLTKQSTHIMDKIFCIREIKKYQEKYLDIFQNDKENKNYLENLICCIETFLFLVDSWINQFYITMREYSEIITNLYKNDEQKYRILYYYIINKTNFLKIFFEEGYRALSLPLHNFSIFTFNEDYHKLLNTCTNELNDKIWNFDFETIHFELSVVNRIIRKKNSLIYKEIEKPRCLNTSLLFLDILLNKESKHN